jgi:hypothetical protein
MKEKGKNWIVSVTAKALEGVLFGSLSKMRRKYSAFLDEAPEAVTKLFYVYSLLTLVVAVTAIGAVTLPVGVIVLLVELLSASVSKTVLSASILLILLGSLYLFGGATVLYMIGRSIHSSVSKATKSFSRKSE